MQDVFGAHHPAPTGRYTKSNDTKFVVEQSGIIVYRGMRGGYGWRATKYASKLVERRKGADHVTVSTTKIQADAEDRFLLSPVKM
jgi:hypothetical protein